MHSLGLVRVLGSLQGAAYALVAYELMDGDLDRFKRDCGFEPEQAAAALGQLSASLLALCRLGVAHRDIKPANVLWQLQEGRLVFKIGDYEAAELTQTVRASKSRSGTPDLQMCTPE